MVAVEEFTASTKAQVKLYLDLMDFQNGNISPDVLHKTILEGLLKMEGIDLKHRVRLKHRPDWTHTVMHV